jgi:hypothetical protein
MQRRAGLETEVDAMIDYQTSGRIASTNPEAIDAEVRRLQMIPNGVECDTRGVCAIPDEEAASGPLGVWGPRLLLLAVCVAYGSNFAFGKPQNSNPKT